MLSITVIPVDVQSGHDGLSVQMQVCNGPKAIMDRTVWMPLSSDDALKLAMDIIGALPAMKLVEASELRSCTRWHRPERTQMMTVNLLLEKIRALGGDTIFSITFKKRTNNQMRTMLCKLGVQKESDNLHNLLRVLDCQKDGFRAIPIDGITKATIKGITYIITKEDENE